MKFNEEINLFDLTEKVLERFRSETGLFLTGYEFEYKFNKDWNCPNNRIKITLSIFGEQYAHTRFDENYNSVDKVVNLLFVHLRDDGEMENLKEGLISAKRYSLESRTTKLSERIKKLSKKLLKTKEIFTMIDEKYPYEEFYENGFPLFQYQVKTLDEKVKINVDLDFNMRGFNENVILEIVEKEMRKSEKY